MASIRLLIMEADSSSGEPVVIQEDAYMLGDQVISRDPMSLFEALGISGVESKEDAYVLLDMPSIEVKKVITEHCVLDHVRALDAVEAAGRCLEWQK